MVLSIRKSGSLAVACVTEITWKSFACVIMIADRKKDGFHINGAAMITSMFFRDWSNGNDTNGHMETSLNPKLYLGKSSVSNSRDGVFARTKFPIVSFSTVSSIIV